MQKEIWLYDVNANQNMKSIWALFFMIILVP